MTTAQSDQNILLSSRRARTAVVWAVMIWVCLFYAGLLGVFIHFGFTRIDTWANQETPWTKLIFDHASAILGIPLACAAALFAVIVLESQYGHMEMRGFGFEFKGAAAPIIMWVLCFLALITGIKLLW